MATLKWHRVNTEQQHGEVLVTSTPKRGEKHVRVWCDSPEEFVARCEAGRHLERGSSSTIDQSSNPWSGSDSFESATDLARSGWSEVRASATGWRDNATAEFARTLAPRWGVEFVRSGGVFDPVRDLVGSQQCYVRPVETYRPNTNARVHRLNVNITATCTNDPAQILRAGSAVVALIDCMRVLGHTAEVVVSETVAGQNNSVCFTGFLLHKANDVVDIDRMSYWLAHPSALRRHIFACNESIGHAPADIPAGEAEVRAERLQRFGFVTGGYGRVSETPTWATEACGITLDLGSTDKRVRSIENNGEIAWIGEQLRLLGVMD